MTFVDATERAKALERALAAMNPPLEVYESILELIAEYFTYGEFGESRRRYVPKGASMRNNLDELADNRLFKWRFAALSLH